LIHILNINSKVFDTSKLSCQKNSFFLKEEGFYSKEIEKHKKKNNEYELLITKLKTEVTEKNDCYNFCKQILEEERERSRKQSRALNSDFDSLNKANDLLLNENKLEYTIIDNQKKKISEYEILITSLEINLKEEQNSHIICKNIVKILEEERQSLKNISSTIDDNSLSKFFPYIILFFSVFFFSQIYLFPVV